MTDEAHDNEPYLQGRVAYELSIPRHKNPYEDTDGYGTTFWESWFDGWDDARDEAGAIRKPLN